MSRPLDQSLARALLGATLASVACDADAATRVWPVLIGPGCNGTLQQCIDGAAPGDTVRIIADDFLVPDSYTAIDESVAIEKSLTLEAAEGIDAVFAPARSIRIDSPASGAHAITLRRLVIRGGTVQVNHRSSDDSTYTIDQLRVEGTDAGAGGCAVRFADFGTGRPSFALGDSSLRFRGTGAATAFAACANGRGGAWQVSFFRNRIDSENAAIAGGLSVSGTSSGPVALSANHVAANGSLRAVLVSQNPGSGPNTLSILHNLVTGQRNPFAIGEGAVQVNLTNTDLRLVNNTVVDNTHAARIVRFASDTSTVRIANNVFAFNPTTGLYVDPALGSATTTGNNVVFGNGPSTFPAHPSNVAADPLFVSRNDPRLRFESPARNAGDNADVPLFFGVAFDADGERRITGGTVDAGAFEWNGDITQRHVATSSNTEGNTTLLEQLPPLSSSEQIQLSPLRGAFDPAEMAQTLGIYQLPGNIYSAFHEDSVTPVSAGRRMHAFAPLLGAIPFVHTTTLASVVDRFSRVTHPLLDSNPGAIAVVTHNWNPTGGAGVYHDHRIGLDYVAPNWFVGNHDGDMMLSGRGFNIAVAPFGSPNAFLRAGSTLAVPELRLEHPLLDDNACATLQVSRVGPTINNVAFSLDYRDGFGGAPGHWFIVAEGSGSPTFPANASFNVLIPGAQANACRINALFSDGFE